ncbi:MAG: aldolase catalytic domain-containing protein, partial [Thermoguttaceae bacterium]|nr:aldolase catalytic domain-containing protein [Thermoguttaceae bacterium]
MSIPWVVSRPEIKVLDCTVRDGGLINNHQFDDAVVRAVYEACVAASIDYMEIGYKNSSRIFSVDENGYWKFCHEDDIRRIVDDNPSEMKLACMIDAGKSDWKTDVLPKDKSVLDLIRVAFYDYQIDEAVDMIQDAYQKGYEVSANLMAVTNVDEVNLDRVLEILIKTPASTIVVVDSYGALLPEQTKYLTKKYLRFAQLADKIVGIHAHNNQQLAFANSIEAIRNGAIRVDATIGGLGRGAGNCP